MVIVVSGDQAITVRRESRSITRIAFEITEYITNNSILRRFVFRERVQNTI